MIWISSHAGLKKTNEEWFGVCLKKLSFYCMEARTVSDG